MVVAALVGKSKIGKSSSDKKKKETTKRLKGEGALVLGMGLNEEDQLLGLMDAMSASIKGVRDFDHWMV
jgi:hypothetical protein